MVYFFAYTNVYQTSITGKKEHRADLLLHKNFSKLPLRTKIFQNSLQKERKRACKSLGFKLYFLSKEVAKSQSLRLELLYFNS